MKSGGEDFAATGGSSNLGMSMISALSEDTPSPLVQSSPKKKGLKKVTVIQEDNGDASGRDDDFERESRDDQETFQPYQEVQLPSKIYSELL